MNPEGSVSFIPEDDQTGETYDHPLSAGEIMDRLEMDQIKIEKFRRRKENKVVR